jgi:hypothetical protein
MKLFWGDLHNHCGITYGFGGLEYALAAAKSQLEFCSITPHAMWPDMPPRTKETEFLVDFHTRGFDKIKQNWQEVKKSIDDANKDNEFVTFFSFEIHSSRYGDYHIVSPDKDLELVYGSSVFDIIHRETCECIGIPHHIGYTPGYRGINWESFDEKISPVVEVCSKHGCAMSDTAPFPYYHDMGPRDSRNTAYAGLKTGKRFGFAGSTDHHAGFPGSYGDGKLAVAAAGLNRESIWRAIKERKTYAVTGDKITCDFTVNSAGFGSVIPFEKKRLISYKVETCDFIDKVVIYKNLIPVKIITGEELYAKTREQKAKKFKVRIEFGWGNDKNAYLWDIDLAVNNGAICNTETCFRGKNILAPAPEQAEDYTINKLIAKIEKKTESSLCVSCETFRNFSTLHPQTSAFIVEISGSEQTRLVFTVNGRRIETAIGELLTGSHTGHMRSYASYAYKIHAAVPEYLYNIEGSFADEDGLAEKSDFYHMEVRQANGHSAYITPVYMNG